MYLYNYSKYVQSNGNRNPSIILLDIHHFLKETTEITKKNKIQHGSSMRQKTAHTIWTRHTNLHIDRINFHRLSFLIQRIIKNSTTYPLEDSFQVCLPWHYSLQFLSFCWYHPINLTLQTSFPFLSCFRFVATWQFSKYLLFF